MDDKEQRQLARKRRERRLRGWLITLSWTTPVVAFGSFFSIWNHISNAVNPPQQSTQVAISSSQGTDSSQSQVLFQIGSKSKQVQNIQEELSELGYFQHVPTHYYGTVTADAVNAFQADHNLPQTGTIDSNTLTAIQQAIKDNYANNMVQPGDESGDGGSYGQPSDGSYSYSNGSGLSQQQSPMTRSSAS